MIACYPTMGLDVLAAQAVYRELFRHAAEGACVVWISEELDDLMSYAHRIAVMHDGRIAGIVRSDEADRQTLGRWMAGYASGGRMMRRRQDPSASPLAGGSAAFLIAAMIFLLAIGRPPLTTLGQMALYAFGDGYSMSESLVKATPILLCALAVILPARLGLITVGGEGQLYFGALTGTAMVVAFPDGPMLAAAAGDAGRRAPSAARSGAARPGCLRARCNVNETISTLLMNYVAVLLVNYADLRRLEGSGAASAGRPASRFRRRRPCRACSAPASMSV